MRVEIVSLPYLSCQPGSHALVEDGVLQGTWDPDMDRCLNKCTVSVWPQIGESPRNGILWVFLGQELPLPWCVK